MAIELNIDGGLYPSIVGVPTHFDTYGKGGYRAVGTIADRDAIPTSLLSVGSLVYVEGENNTYIYRDGGTWDTYGIGVIGGGQVSDNDVLRYGTSGWEAKPLIVTSNDITDGAVIAGKLGERAVGADNIIDGAIHTENIHDGAITDAKLALGMGLISKNIKVRSGHSPTTLKTLDLSRFLRSVIGSAGGIALLSISNTDPDNSADFIFEETYNNGITITSGMSTVSLPSGTRGLIIGIISDKGYINWKASAQVRCNIYLVGYMNFRE
jgi:hypothetical protein